MEHTRRLAITLIKRMAEVGHFHIDSTAVRAHVLTAGEKQLQALIILPKRSERPAGESCDSNANRNDFQSLQHH
jgi:hypothetical protein